MTCRGSSSSLAVQELSPLVRRAIRQSKRRSRQIWIVWIGSRIALRNAYRLGRGTLIARIIGEEVFPSEYIAVRVAGAVPSPSATLRR